MKGSRTHVVHALALTIALAFGVICAGVRASNPASADSSARSATALYSQNCISCHGTDGRSRTRKGKLKLARDLTDSDWQGNVSNERIFNSISNGRGKMPSFNKKMSEAEIDSLVLYVRGLKK
ncbi:MAG: cytochrome c [bacterium]